MNKSIWILVAIACATTAFAQSETPASSPAATPSDIESLRQQVQALTETVKALQQQVKDQQTALERVNGAAASEKESASAEPTSSPEPSAAPQFPTEDSSVVESASASEKPGPSIEASPGAFPTTDTSVVASTTPESGLTAPITIGGGKNYMNISFDGMFALAYSSDKHLDRIEVGDHDPQQRGFNARNIELAFDGAVDPYFEGFANIVFKLDNNNETEVEVEEAFLQTTNLPLNLQLKGGQFFAAFGRLNPTHPHVWEFADAPLVSGRLLGPDGLRGVGGQISWLIPVPWYAQVILGVQNGRGGTAYSFRNPGDDGVFFGRMTTDREIRGLYDFLWLPRLETSFNLSDTQTILLGASGAFGSNDTGPHARTQIYGGDFLYKWKSANAEGGFPFVKWQTEYMYRRFEAGRGLDDTFPVAETFHDWGLYSQVLWGFKKGWVAGVRGDYLHLEDSRFTDDPDRQSRSRVSANLTWYLTEFSKIRLQYNHDFLEENFFLADKDVDSVFLQFEFILGSHGAHKF